MARWKLILSYDGSSFHGWQVQPGKPTIQGALRDTLSNITGESVLPQGAGRTDSGVHALAQVASFDLAIPIPPANLLTALNRALPPAIRVNAAEVVPETFHARHGAVGKSYEYRVFPRLSAPASDDGHDSARICSPFLAPFVWDCRWLLDVAAMQLAAISLCGTHDFTSFAAADPDLGERSQGRPGPNPVKTIHASSCTLEGDLLLYRVSGSGFLHHMVRNLVGTLVEVGRGALNPAEMPRILAACDRSAAGPTAPPQGLYLVSVDYEMVAE